MLKYCCPDLEKLAHPADSGLGLVIAVRRRVTLYHLEYRKDWHVPHAESAINIAFCPFCGCKLPSLHLEMSGLSESGSV